MNSSGVIQSASDSVEQVFGWSPTELYGRNLRELVPEPRRSDLDRYLDRYRKPGLAKSLQQSHRFDALRKDGTAIQIELSLSRADLPTLASSYFVGIVRDVSRTIDTDSDPVIERTLLQHLVTEQTRALATAHLRLLLSDRLATLGTLSAGLGHDMNNVLLPVRARLNALEQSGLTKPALAHVAVVRAAVAYLQHLSDGLHFLAPEAETFHDVSHHLEVTDLPTWWAQVGTLMRLAIPTSISFSSRFEPGLPPVAIAAHWLTQAVLNCIVNAGEAMSKVRRKPSITLSASPSDDGRFVRLSIVDNGRGMKEAVIRRVFDLFFTTKSRSLGTGLGLPLARRVITQAGGTIEITSKPGKGTTVLVSIPVAAKAIRQKPGAKAREAEHPLLAVISLRTPRLAALYAQVLLGAGFQVRGGTKGATRPGNANTWLLEPRPGNIKKAERWVALHPSSTVVCIGAPGAKEVGRWATIGAVVIESPEDYVSIRSTVRTLASTKDAKSTTKNMTKNTSKNTSKDASKNTRKKRTPKEQRR
jgi:PAS domain S-box-containing protein